MSLDVYIAMELGSDGDLFHLRHAVVECTDDSDSPIEGIIIISQMIARKPTLLSKDAAP